MYKTFKHGVSYFCLQASATQHLTDTCNLTIQLGQQLNTRITNVSVSFMNTAGVAVVVTVLANFQVQIVLDL